jgi:hypothetical protein
MTFEEILDQAIAMLQRRGRVTYRTLRLQFHLDEELLEALKEALIDAERLAVDEEGRVLVWMGGAEPPPSSPPRSTTHTSQPLLQGGYPASDGISPGRTFHSRGRTPPAHRDVP